MQRPKMIENAPDKIRARARKMLQHGIGDFVWASGNGQKRFLAAARNSVGKKEEQKEK